MLLRRRKRKKSDVSKREETGERKGKLRRARWSGRWGVNYLVTLLQRSEPIEGKALMILRRAGIHEGDGDEGMMRVVSNGGGSGYPLSRSFARTARSPHLAAQPPFLHFYHIVIISIKWTFISLCSTPLLVTRRSLFSALFPSRNYNYPSPDSLRRTVCVQCFIPPRD